MFYVRWKKGESRRGRVWEPASHRDDIITESTCLSCSLAIGKERAYQLVIVGPDDLESRKKHEADRWYAARAMVMHEDCVSGRSDLQLDTLASEIQDIFNSWMGAPRDPQ